MQRHGRGAEEAFSLLVHTFVFVQGGTDVTLIFEDLILVNSSAVYEMNVK